MSKLKLLWVFSILSVVVGSSNYRMIRDTANSAVLDSPEEETILQNVDIDDQAINATLSKHPDINNKTTDNHKYYKSNMYPNNNFWVDLDALNKSIAGIVQEHSMLSQSYRHAATISLTFRFPFYGHFVRNITIATGGFLYTGEYVHSWLAATQYIAPLMANFDTSQHETAKIRYADNGTALIVEWQDVYLKGSIKEPESNTTSSEEEEAVPPSGPFTFQVIIHKNGNIVFAYKTIPIIISTIEDKVHPVKVGLSDAYIIDRTIFFVRRKTIYEYHRVNLKNSLIANSSAIVFTAIPTCNLQSNCTSCLSLAQDQSFECHWCPSLKRCSDGMDRHRQNWLKFNCDKYNVEKLGECGKKTIRPPTRNFYPDDSRTINTDPEDENHDATPGQEITDNGKKQGLTATAHANIVGIVIICLLLCSFVGWFGYAYFYPHTWSGQLLIKYRPTRWHWRRGEARYTAASIHM